MKLPFDRSLRLQGSASEQNLISEFGQSKVDIRQHQCSHGGIRKELVQLVGPHPQTTRLDSEGKLTPLPSRNASVLQGWRAHRAVPLIRLYA